MYTKNKVTVDSSVLEQSYITVDLKCADISKDTVDKKLLDIRGKKIVDIKNADIKLQLTYI